MNILNAILNIIFPTKCFVCGKKNEIFCFDCLSKSQICQKENINWIFSLYDYQDKNIKKSIKLLKYKNKKNIAKIFAQSLYDFMLEELSDVKMIQNFTQPILIPIPLSKKRLVERGYNQAELIAKELLKLNQNLFILEKNVLYKWKETKHQAEIKNKKERLENLKDSFRIKNEKKIKNRNIILIDDVSTTGATLKEARKTLLNAGTKKIIAFTLAH